jgi:hypothetical protein
MHHRHLATTARRRLLVFPGGTGVGSGTHLSVDLQVVDDMWTPTASATLTLVNQADGDKSFSVGEF